MKRRTVSKRRRQVIRTIERRMSDLVFRGQRHSKAFDDLDKKLEKYLRA